MAFTLLAPSLKTRLYGLVVFIVVIILAVVVSGICSYSNIDRANATKAELNHLITILQDARIAEKTYLQFFSKEVKGQFEHFTINTVKVFDTVSSTAADRKPQATDDRQEPARPVSAGLR